MRTSRGRLPTTFSRRWLTHTVHETNMTNPNPSCEPKPKPIRATLTNDPKPIRSNLEEVVPGKLYCSRDPDRSWKKQTKMRKNPMPYIHNSILRGPNNRALVGSSLVLVRNPASQEYVLTKKRYSTSIVYTIGSTLSRNLQRYPLSRVRACLSASLVAGMAVYCPISGAGMVYCPLPLGKRMDCPPL